MSFTFNDELKALIDLINFKQYKRDGCVLYAKYQYFKPECTITELVWGFCRNPCYAKRLARELYAIIPDYTQLLSKANESVTNDILFSSFDNAMRCLSSFKKDRIAKSIVFSNESTNLRDRVIESTSNIGQLVKTLNATDDDGEVWCGIIVPDIAWTDSIENVCVTIYDSQKDANNLLWKYQYSRASVAKRIKNRNGIYVFQPFKHALPILDLNIRVETQITYRADAQATGESQLFGILSDKFCDWLRETSLEIKLRKAQVALVNMSEKTILFQ